MSKRIQISMLILPDSSVLIPYLTRQAYIAQVERTLHSERFALSSVVVAEILAGARGQFERLRLDRFFTRCLRRGMLVTPNSEAWATCGRLLSRAREGRGDLQVRDHQNDNLILLSARQLAPTDEVVVLTENDKHFRIWLDLIGARDNVRIEAMRR
jgi:predicted nucleic acid-binding protein